MALEAHRFVIRTERCSARAAAEEMVGGTHSRANFFVLGALPPLREPAATLGILQIYPYGVYWCQLRENTMPGYSEPDLPPTPTRCAL